MENTKKVKRLKATTSYNNSDVKYLSAIHEYDENGNQTLDASFSEDGETENKTISIYDNKNRRTEILIYFDNEQLSSHSIFEYNENDKIINEAIKYNDGSSSIKIYNYEKNKTTIIQTDDEGELEEKEVLILDEAERVIERIIYDDTNTQKERHQNTYSEDGTLINRIEYGQKNDFVAERQFKYDENKNLIMRKSVNQKGGIIDLIKYKYNEQNKLVEQEMKNHFIVKYIYDEEKREMIEERYHANGILVQRTLSRFNADRFLVEEQHLEHTITYEYELY